ncbi:MAG: pyridoxal phosphate-dependent aminotransferase [Anaerovoracaceae bacterium]|jgi:aspartate aminotransferase
MKFSSKIERCALSPIRKFYPYQVEYVKQGKKIYHLNIGQPDIKTPPIYFETLRNFEQPVLEYAPSPGIPVLIEAVQKYFEEIGIRYDTSDIMVTTGGSEALIFALATILDEGDEILVPEPFYPNYNTFVNTTGGKIVPIPTTPEEGYRFADKARIEKLITPKTRAIMFTNPGNPTGVVLTHDECKMLADLAVEHNLFLIADEVYREFIYSGAALSSMASFDHIDQNLILIDSVSKRFSACGARIGVVVSKNKEFMNQLLKLCQARLSVATLDQLASAQLYTVEKSYFDEVRTEYKKRRDTVYGALQKLPGVLCTEPQGAFYLMAKLPVKSADDFQVWLLTQFHDNNETVMYAPGGGFYATPGKGLDEIRIAYVLNSRDLERAIELLGMGLERYNG